MAIQGLDFSRLSLQDALDLAILIEEEAKERYHEFAHQMELHRTPGAARFFSYMAENEEKHGTALSARRISLFGDTSRKVTRAMIFDVEAPDYDEARAFMSPRLAMQAALASEQKAHAFFLAALPSITDPEVKALFEELGNEELEHQGMVKTELAKLPPDPAISDEDFVDEPAAQ